MSWEGIGVILTGVGMIVSLTGGAAVLALTFGKMIARLDHFTLTFNTFVNTFERHLEKEDATHSVMWSKLDGHSASLIEHNQRIQTIEKKVEHGSVS